MNLCRLWALVLVSAGLTGCLDPQGQQCNSNGVCPEGKTCVSGNCVDGDASGPASQSPRGDAATSGLGGDPGPDGDPDFSIGAGGAGGTPSAASDASLGDAARGGATADSAIPGGDIGGQVVGGGEPPPDAARGGATADSAIPGGGIGGQVFGGGEPPPDAARPTEDAGRPPDAAQGCVPTDDACETGQDGRCASGLMGCDGAVRTCIAINEPTPETCNREDDDCDGDVDEDVDGAGVPCEAGRGECRRPGEMSCGPAGALTCDAVAGAPIPEVCDASDNNCDGQVDEDFDVGGDCVAGGGACLVAGHLRCRGDATEVECDAAPRPGSVELCDGIDNDCDDTVDDVVGAGVACSAGVGACAVAGVMACDPRGSLSCDAVGGVADVETCDGLDNDCDGEVDNVVGAGGACSAGVGECARAGTTTCAPGGGGTECDAIAGAPDLETCDGLDNDCDGEVDEGYVPVEACGLGACRLSSVPSECVDGVEQSCRPGSPLVAYDNECDGIDNDCDGGVDEDADVLADPLNCGACGVECAPENATGTCIIGDCRIRTCDSGFVDFNESIQDGCERPTRVIYLSPGAQGGDGSAGRPFGRLSEALASGGARTTYVLSSGRYSEDQPLVINEDSSVIMGVGDPPPEIQGPFGVAVVIRNSTDLALMSLRTPQGLTIEGGEGITLSDVEGSYNMPGRTPPLLATGTVGLRIFGGHFDGAFFDDAVRLVDVRDFVAVDMTIRGGPIAQLYCAGETSGIRLTRVIGAHIENATVRIGACAQPNENGNPVGGGGVSIESSQQVAIQGGSFDSSANGVSFGRGRAGGQAYGIRLTSCSECSISGATVSTRAGFGESGEQLQVNGDCGVYAGAGGRAIGIDVQSTADLRLSNVHVLSVGGGSGGAGNARLVGGGAGGSAIGIRLADASVIQHPARPSVIADIHGGEAGRAACPPVHGPSTGLSVSSNGTPIRLQHLSHFQVERVGALGDPAFLGQAIGVDLDVSGAAELNSITISDVVGDPSSAGIRTAMPATIHEAVVTDIPTGHCVATSGPRGAAEVTSSLLWNCVAQSDGVNVAQATLADPGPVTRPAEDLLVFDAASPSIDIGRALPVGFCQEPKPNGGRVNAGALGGSALATPRAGAPHVACAPCPLASEALGRRCDTLLEGKCNQGTTTCGLEGPTCAADFGPSDETCNELDDDCDGAVDEDPCP